MKRHAQPILECRSICQPMKTGQKTLFYGDTAGKSMEGRTFEVKVRKAFRGDATLRQIAESLDIRQEAPRMNNKEEWSGPLRLPQINIDTE